MASFPSNRPWVRGRFTYECSLSAPITPETPAGELLEQLLALIGAGPAYLRAADRQRYAAFLEDFRRFTVCLGWGTLTTRTAVGALPLKHLALALRDWIGSHSNGPSALYGSFAIDAARFIEAHAWGRDFGFLKTAWQLKGAIESWEGDEPDTVAGEWKLKKQITERLAGTLVKLHIPDGSRIVARHPDRTMAGHAVGYFSVKRCHLSTTAASEFSLGHFNIEEDEPPAHDIGHEFNFQGTLWPAEAIEAKLAGRQDFPYENYPGYAGEIPGRWIVAELTRDRTWLEMPTAARGA